VPDAQVRAAVDRQASDVLVVDENAPGFALHQANDHVKRRRLAGAVRPQESYDLATAEREAQILDHLPRTIPFGEPLDLELAHAPGSPNGIVRGRWSRI